VPDCISKVIHLPRHLEEIHHWKPDKARKAIQIFGLRKVYSTKGGTQDTQECRHSRQCPMDRCSAAVKRLSPHLSGYHHLDKRSVLYRSMLVLARKRSRACAQIEDDVSSFADSSSVTSAKADDVCSDDLDDVPSNDGDSTGLGDLPSNGSDNDDNDGDGGIESNMAEQICQLPADFLQFVSWLQSPDGGRKCEKSAKQHGFQVGVIFDAIDPDKNVSSLWCKKSLTKFLTVDAAEKQFLPGTTKSYLNSLRHWYAYILSEEADRLSQSQKQQIQQTSDRVARWIASYRKDSAARSLEKMDSDISKLITPEKVALFDRSESALAAIKCLGDVADGSSQQDVSMSEYILVRDFVLTQIIISNANRSGVLANMTLDEFSGAQLVDGSYVLSVTSHKTAFMYGPAKIVLTPILYSWMSVFVKYLRSQITKRITGNAKYVFLSWTGQKLDSGQVTCAIQTAWKKAGLGPEITCTLMRKSAVSSVYQKHPEQKSNLADLMCHTVQTAGKSYRLVNRQHTSVTASTLLTRVMKTGGVAVVTPTDDVSAAEQIPVEIGSQTKFVWTESFLVNLRTIFSDEIKSRSVSLQSVRDKSNGTVLACIDPRKIYDRLRQECAVDGAVGSDVVMITGSDEQAGALDVPQDSLHDRVNRMASVGNSSVTKKCDSDHDDSDSDIVGPSVKSVKSLFSASEALIIQEACVEIIKSGPISMKRIGEAMGKSPDAASILHKFTTAQIVSRVKYERRKLGVPKFFMK